MKKTTEQITLSEWDVRYERLAATGLREPFYGGRLGRHVEDGNLRLPRLRYDSSTAALRLWNFLLTEESRLHQARAEGCKLVGTMKDLGTVPVMAYSLPNLVAFYPDGAWWIPCLMELSAGLLGVADRLGVDEAVCPVRAMLGAFVTGAHFPMPDLLTCSVGATCDDFSAIAQRLNGLGHAIMWWEIPHRREPDAGESGVTLPGGRCAPQAQIEFVSGELQRLRRALEALAGATLDDDMLAAGIGAANGVRRVLAELRRIVFTAPTCPIPALEMHVAEMLAIHFCSDRGESLLVLEELLSEARARVSAGQGVLRPDAARLFWVNPVADLRVMNLVEEYGGRICGTDYMFCQALDQIPEDVPPLEALARTALSDPMVGSAMDRAARVCADVQAYGAEGVVVSRIPGASHCATEGDIIRDTVASQLGLPTVEVEVPPVLDSYEATLRTRLEALVEAVRQRRRP